MLEYIHLQGLNNRLIILINYSTTKIKIHSYEKENIFSI